MLLSGKRSPFVSDNDLNSLAVATARIVRTVSIYCELDFLTVLFVVGFGSD
jgi:hypothetical protein